MVGIESTRLFIAVTPPSESHLGMHTVATPSEAASPTWHRAWVDGGVSMTTKSKYGAIRLRMADDAARGADPEFFELAGLAASPGDELVQVPGVEPGIGVRLGP